MKKIDKATRSSAQVNLNNVLDKKNYGMFDAYSQITDAARRSATLTVRYRV